MSRLHARFVRESILAAGAALAVLVGFNAATDPTRSLYPDRGIATQVANDRAVKLQALLARPDTPELLVMGSSASAVIPPDAMAQALGYRSGYNLALVDGTPAEALAILQLLHAQGRAPKAITYGIDPMPFANAGGLPSERKKLLPGQGLWEKIHVAARHLTAPLPASLMDYRATLSDPLVVLDRTDGRLHYPRWETDIQSNAEAYEAEVLRKAGQGLRVVFRKEPFDDLHRLAAWLDEHDVRAAFYISPFHPRLGPSTDPAILSEYRELTFHALSGHQFLDLSGITDARRKHGFYDPIHFRSQVAQSLIRHLHSERVIPRSKAHPTSENL